MGVIADKIRRAIFGGEVRDSIADGIEVVEQLREDYDNQVINAGNSNAEIVDARGGQTKLKDRLDNFDEQLDNNTKNIDGILNLEYYRFLVVDNDWTMALQTALNTGRNVEISKMYNIKSVTLSSDKQCIYAHGRNCGFNAIDKTKPCLIITGIGNIIKNLSFTTSLNGENEDFSAIKCLNSVHTILDNIYCTSSFTNTIVFENCSYPMIKDSYIGGGNKKLIKIKAGTFTRIKDTMIHQPNTSLDSFESLIDLENAPSVYIKRCHLTRGKGRCINAFADPDLFMNTYLLIEDCDMDNSDNDGVYCEGYWHVHIKDNWISACRDIGKKSIYLKNCKKIYVENNDCYASNQGYGIFLENCDSGTISKNTSEHHLFCIKTKNCSNISLINNIVCAVTALPSFGTANARAFEDEGNSINCNWDNNILVNAPQLENYQGIREDRIRHLDAPRILRPTLQNDWTNVEYRGIGYYIDNSKVVHLFGEATGGLESTTVFTLPNGFTPSTTKIFKENNGNTVTIMDNGNVQFNTNSAVNLNGISFLVGEY